MTAPRPLITLDCDGTIFDPWACCQRRDTWAGSPTCAHVRQDIQDRVLHLCADYGADVVVLSWRGGGTHITREWFRRTLLSPTAYHIPGSPDDISQRYRFWRRRRKHLGQIDFKVATVERLLAKGHTIVESLDDNANVCAALGSLGVKTYKVPRQVRILPHEWAAGYIGAPRPKPKRRTTALGEPVTDTEQFAWTFDNVAQYDYADGCFIR